MQILTWHREVRAAVCWPQQSLFPDTRDTQPTQPTTVHNCKPVPTNSNAPNLTTAHQQYPRKPLGKPPEGCGGRRRNILMTTSRWLQLTPAVTHVTFSPAKCGRHCEEGHSLLASDLKNPFFFFLNKNLLILEFGF